MEEELKPRTGLHYNFCGPSGLSDFAPPTIVLHFPGKPIENTLEKRIDELAKSITAIPDVVAKAISQACNDGKEFETPEDMATKGMANISKALIAMARKCGVREDENQPSPKKTKIDEKPI